MSLKKSTEIPGGYVGEYWSIKAYERLDFIGRKAVVIFSLWKDAAAYAAGETAQPENAGRLVLEGERFDFYLSKAALAAAETDINAQTYLAAKAEPMDFWFARASRYLADAENV